MKTILFSLILLYSSFKPKDNGCLQLDLILLGDFSQSVQGYEPFISKAFSSFIDTLELSEEGVKVSIILFNTYTTTLGDLTSDKSLLSRRAQLIKTYNADGGTNLDGGFYTSFDQLVQHGRQGYKKIIILVTDGDVDDKESAFLLSQQLKLAGVTICGVLIKDSTNKPEFMKTICGDCYVESNYENLAGELKKLDICL